jgi:hypothetical protein
MDMHFVLEWSDSEFFKKSSLGRVNLISSFDDCDWIYDFNLGFHNLSLDRKILEESGLFGIKTSWTWLNGDFSGGN